MNMTAGSLHTMLTAMAIMVLPALVICLGITLMAFRRRDQSPRSATGRPEQRQRPL
jgi:uncharacterized membrane protein